MAPAAGCLGLVCCLIFCGCEGDRHVQSISVFSSELEQTHVHPSDLLVIVILVEVDEAFAEFFEIKEVCVAHLFHLVGLRTSSHPHNGVPLLWTVDCDVFGGRFYGAVDRVIFILCVTSFQKLVSDPPEITFLHGIPVHGDNKAVSVLTATIVREDTL